MFPPPPTHTHTHTRAHPRTHACTPDIWTHRAPSSYTLSLPTESPLDSGVRGSRVDGCLSVCRKRVRLLLRPTTGTCVGCACWAGARVFVGARVGASNCSHSALL